jgi:hypothetical protein
MNSESKLGSTPPANAARDAVHVAMIPLIASETLRPGYHCGTLDGVHATMFAKATGIVDPFLDGSVKEGERFWLCLYPGTVTSIRHDWTHPAIPSIKEPGYVRPDDKSVSEAWLRSYATRMNSYEDPPEAFETLIEGLSSGSLFAHGSDMHSIGDVDDIHELKKHAEIFLDRTIDFDKFEFSCSC